VLRRQALERGLELDEEPVVDDDVESIAAVLCTRPEATVGERRASRDSRAKRMHTLRRRTRAGPGPRCDAPR